MRKTSWRSAPHLLAALLLIAAAGLYRTARACANCTPQQVGDSVTTFDQSCSNGTNICWSQFTKNTYFHVRWPDGTEMGGTDVFDQGEFKVSDTGMCSYPTHCWPSFETPYTYTNTITCEGVFQVTTRSGYCNANFNCTVLGGVGNDHRVTHQCLIDLADGCRMPGCEEGDWGCDHTEGDCSGWYHSCDCLYEYPSPLLVDTEGNGFRLTAPQAGVGFDLDGDGTTEHTSWTAAGTDDAWLALDRNGNGVIDDGRELFGNFTDQPPVIAGEQKHGFRSLAVFDTPASGGNGDGKIDARDQVFPSPRLWRDDNHDGISQSAELHVLPALGVTALDLNYKEARWRDAYGNQFRYRARATGPRGQPFAYDVFLAAP